MNPNPQWLGGKAQVAALWVLLAVALTGAAFVVLQSSTAQSEDGEGIIELSELDLSVDNMSLHLQVDATVRLSSTVQAGLDSGVPLTFLLNLEVIQARRFWIDKTVLEFQRQYTLTYYDLTRHYRVSALESDASRNFRSLSSALEGLGEMVHMSVELDVHQAAELERNGLQAVVNMQLSRSALPLPLQPIIRSSWTMVSGEYRWPIT